MIRSSARVNLFYAGVLTPFFSISMAFSNLQSCFLLFSFRNPAAVLLAVRVTQLVENRAQSFFPHQVFKLSGNFEVSYLVIFPNNDLNGIARAFPGLFAYGL